MKKRTEKSISRSRFESAERKLKDDEARLKKYRETVKDWDAALKETGVDPEIACARRDPQSKGIVEAGVRYVKYNALQGRS